jgi:hypothetical protein
VDELFDLVVAEILIEPRPFIQSMRLVDDEYLERAGLGGRERA